MLLHECHSENAWQCLVARNDSGAHEWCIGKYLRNIQQVHDLCRQARLEREQVNIPEKGRPAADALVKLDRCRVKAKNFIDKIGRVARSSGNVIDLADEMIFPELAQRLKD